MSAGRLDPYVPRVTSEWDEVAPRSLWRQVDGSLVLVDISGFTRLSERLAGRGRIGAEELTGVLDRVFSLMLESAYERGGSLLKFGGDALLFLFDQGDHRLQACAAAVEMRSALREAATTPTSVGRIGLQMSTGIHSGPIDLFLVGSTHRELVVTGPAASTTVAMEAIAGPGEIVVSRTTAEGLPPGYVGQEKGEGRLLRKRRIDVKPGGVVVRKVIPDSSIAQFISSGLRAHLESGVSDSEHRMATVAFVHFGGVDALIARDGAASAATGLERLIEAAQSAAESEGTTFLASDVDSDGGKIILTAGVPSRREDDEGRMLRTCRRILEAESGLELGVGVSRGHVFSGDIGTDFRRTYTVMGDTVNLAARLMSAAGAGNLYSTTTALDQSTTLFRTEALAPFRVKGKDATIHAYSVHEETGTRPPDSHTHLPFHGRRTERDLLAKHIEDAIVEHPGKPMTITGPTGSGKTRLVAETIDGFSDVERLTIQGEPTGSDNPYWAFRDPMRRALGIDRTTQAKMAADLRRIVESEAPQLAPAMPLLGDVLHIEVPDTTETAVIDPRFRPDRTADAVVELMSSFFPGPLLIIAEDGHWMDEASLGLLARIGVLASDQPWALILTGRREGSAFEPLGDEVALRPLDNETVAAIVRESTAAAPLRPHENDAVVARAGGNPLFLSALLEMIRETGSADQLPESLDAVVSAEIDTLPPLTRRVLRYMSTLGRSFRRVVLDALLGDEAGLLDEATRDDLNRFVEPDGTTRLRFRHAVVQTVAYEGLSFRRRRELHARAGEVIEHLAGDDPEAVAEFLAYHYAESGSHDKVWQYARIAGDKAVHAYANTEAATQFRRAVEASRWIDVTGAERATVLEGLAHVQERLGAFDDALGSYRRARRDWLEPERRARNLFQQAIVMQKKGKPSQALGLLTRSAGLLSAAGDDGLMTHILAQRASIRQLQGRNHEAIRLAERALAEADSDAASPGLFLALSILDLASAGLGEASDHAASVRALEMADELGDLHSKAGVLLNLGMYAYYEGKWDEAAGLYAQSSETFHRAGNDIAAAYGKANHAEILSDQGRLDEAEAEFARVLPVFQAANDQLMMAFVLTHLGRLTARRGRVDLANQYFDQAEGMYEMCGAPAEQALLSRAETLATTGHVEQAREILTRDGGFDPEKVPARLRPVANRAHGLVALAGGDHEAGVELMRAALQGAVELDSRVDELLAINFLAATGSADAALSHRAGELSAQLGVISLPLVQPDEHRGDGNV